MTEARTQSYRMVVKTIEDMGPSKLFLDEQQQIRDAADELIFATRDGVEVIKAMEAISRLGQTLVQSGRWTEQTATRLVDDVISCGPAMALVA